MRSLLPPPLPQTLCEAQMYFPMGEQSNLQAAWLILAQQDTRHSLLYFSCGTHFTYARSDFYTDLVVCPLRLDLFVLSKYFDFFEQMT